jgi:NADH:ubiquinone oxidoreductase subunit 6 (subunit J)
MLRERLQGFNSKKIVFIYLIPLYIFFILFMQILIVDSFENISYLCTDLNSFGLNSGMVGKDYVFFNLLFGKYSEIKLIAVLFFTKFISLFIASGLLLLITLIGSIAVLTRDNN